MKETVKKIWFLIHKYGTYITPYLWIYNNNMVFFYWLIIVSWRLNKNRCLISELEYYVFGETFMGLGRKYYVPKIHRYILYINFLIGSIFYLKEFI